jgi:hypothetical protein
VDVIALPEEQLGQVGAVLSGDSGDECGLAQRLMSPDDLDAALRQWKGADITKTRRIDEKAGLVFPLRV